MSVFGKTIIKTPLKTAKTSNRPFSAVRGSYGPRFHRLFNGRSIFSILVFSKQLANYMVTTTLADPNLDLNSIHCGPRVSHSRLVSIVVWFYKLSVGYCILVFPRQSANYKVTDTN